jgi:hypothetical protein
LFLSLAIPKYHIGKYHIGAIAKRPLAVSAPQRKTPKR